MRFALKHRTAIRHQKVDDAFSKLDLTDAHDYAVFLQSHYLAYSALSHVQNIGMILDIDSIKQALKMDLSALNMIKTKFKVPEFDKNADILGVGYVLGGSHFGKKLLIKRWAKSMDKCVTSAGAYLAHDGLEKTWKIVAQKIQKIDMSQPGTDQIFSAANDTFALFGASLQEVQNHWECCDHVAS